MSSYPHDRRQKALHKAYVAMENKLNLEQNRVFCLEDSMGLYSIYNSDPLEQLVNTMHKMHNKTTWNEKLLAGKIDSWFLWYLSKDQVANYAINSLLLLTTIREKYVKMYERSINQLLMYARVIRLFEVIFAYFSMATIKTEQNVSWGQKGYSDYKSWLWYNHKKIIFILWCKASYIWHWHE